MGALMEEMAVFRTEPVWVLLPALVLLVLYRVTRVRMALIAMWAWLVYGLYESAMLLELICPQGCNIRIDLLLIFPVLLILSLMAVLMVALSVFKPPHS